MAMLSHSETLLRLLAAAALGSLIGFERERLLWAAGIRTHMLVCVGACLFMIVSAYGFSTSLGANVVLDRPAWRLRWFPASGSSALARSWREAKSSRVSRPRQAFGPWRRSASQSAAA